MKGLLYFALLFAIMALAPACRTTTKVVTQHDTLTIERMQVQQVVQHDTITIKDNTERIEERVIYDTLERVREVVRVQYRNKYIKEAGSGSVQVVHDTITIKQGSASQAKETKPARSATGIIWLVVAILTALFGYIYYIARRLE